MTYTVSIPSAAARRKAMEAYNRGAAARQERSRSTVTGALALLGLSGDPYLGIEDLYAWERTEQANSIYYAEMRAEVASLDGGWLHGGFRFEDDDT